MTHGASVRAVAVCVLSMSAWLGGCAGDGRLETVAAFPERQVTGVSVSSTGRVFACFPYWGVSHGISVVEIGPDGGLSLYPDERWNSWDGSQAGAGDHFVCVQSVVVDDEDQLWILDPASPRLAGTVPGGPKLIQVDLASDEVVRVIHFDESVAPSDSYLNDVRVDPDRRTAYITESGTGSLVVVNLADGSARRVLAGHPSTQAEPGVVPVIGGREWRGPQGQAPRVHADGIALTPDGSILYYKALTGRRLYRIPTSLLRRANWTDEQIAGGIQPLGETEVCDGMVMDDAGVLYLTALERDAIVRFHPDGKMDTLIADDRLAWPDSLAIGPNGGLYITVSKIHLAPRFNDGREVRTEPYRIYKLPEATASDGLDRPVVGGLRNAR